MTEPIDVTQEVAAPTAVVWSLLVDLDRMREWSSEADGITWLHGASGPAVGASFRGTNRRGSRSWSTIGTITALDTESTLAFEVSKAGLRIAEWRYELAATPAGCTVTERWTDRRSALGRLAGKLVTGVDDRGAHNRSTMAETLANLRAAAERLASA